MNKTKSILGGIALSAAAALTLSGCAGGTGGATRGSVTRRPDRVMMRQGGTERQVVVVDYKFGEHETAGHRRQIGEYMRLLREMGYEFVNTLFTDEWYSDEAMEERGVVQVPLCFLAKSLENMSLCHVAYFCPGWENARGCKIEHITAVFVFIQHQFGQLLLTQAVA